MLLLHILWFLSLANAAKVTETLHLTWEKGAPDGQLRNLIYINGQFPGPALVFDEDDDVEITVINDMPRNTTVHWHGLTQQGNPWADGVIGLTQTPILPGEQFVYRFRASPAGLHWYHSHERMSLSDGLYGPLFIRSKDPHDDIWASISSDPEDIRHMAQAAANSELVVISDWSQYTSDEYWQAILDSGLLIFCMDSVLINGQGSVYCLPTEFLNGQLDPHFRQLVFGPNDSLTDKGCLPFVQTIEGGPWNYTYHPEKVPPRLNDGCIPSDRPNATIEVDASIGWASLSFVAATTNVHFFVSLDDHEMWLYEMNGNHVKPRKFVAISMASGETFSVLVKLDRPPGTYTLRVPDSGATQIISGFANVVYKNARTDAAVDSVDATRAAGAPWLSYGGLAPSEEIRNRSFAPWIGDTMEPWPTTPVPYGGQADDEYLLVIGRLGSAYNYTMRRHYMYPGDFHADDPLLFNPNATLGTEEDNLVIRTRNGSWVDLILEVSTMYGDTTAFMHYMHKHGNRAWLIGQGKGSWAYSSVTEARLARPQDFNLVNPGYGDTWLTQFSPGGGYWTVLRYFVDNPGPWLFHCHLELHVMGGMSLAILDGVDAWPDTPAEHRPGFGGIVSQDGFLHSMLSMAGPDFWRQQIGWVASCIQRVLDVLTFMQFGRVQ